LIISDVLKKRLIEDLTAITILQYIKENERDPRGISKDRVAKVMHEKDVCSRATTLKIIDSLIQAEIIKDRGSGRRNFNNLMVDESFPFEDIMKESFYNYASRLEKNLEPFADLIMNNKIKDKAKIGPKGKPQVLLSLE